MLFKFRIILSTSCTLALLSSGAGCSSGKADQELLTTPTTVLSNAILTIRSATDTDGVVSATCETGELASGGGCRCGLTAGGTVFGTLGTTIGWVCGCSAAVEVEAAAYCFRAVTEEVLADATLVTASSRGGTGSNRREEGLAALREIEKRFSAALGN